MKIRFHPHALERLSERGTTRKEVIQTIRRGESFPAKFGRTGFRLNFDYSGQWHGKSYSNKQVEAYAAKDNGWLVITVIVKYF